MIPSRPYLLRAIYEWLADNNMTPYMMVDAEQESVEVPLQYVEDGRIILNISPTATQNLSLDNDAVSFNARFGGKPQVIYVPMVAILAVYSRETGQGSIFKPEEGLVDQASIKPDPPEPPSPSKKKKGSASGRANLRVVK